MVDFDNEVTVGIPAVDVEKISILQRRHDLLEAYEDYKKKRFSGAGVPLSFVRARLISLFLEVQAMLQRRMKPEVYNKFKEDCFTEKADENSILELVYIINGQLDEIKLTRVDTQKVYNERRVEEENKVKNF